MALQNKLGITDSAGLACVEEPITKQKALAILDTGFLDTLEGDVE